MQKLDLINYQNLLLDGGIKKKVNKVGFGEAISHGEEVTMNYTSSLEDDTSLENTYVTKEPCICILGKNSILPGLEIALSHMKMGEEAKIIINPEYSFLLQERLKQIKESKSENYESFTNIDFSKPLSKELLEEISRIKTKIQLVKLEEVEKMENKEKMKYLPVIYEVEISKVDRPRKNKSMMEPEERISEACYLKNEGNDLFKLKRYREAIVKYNTGINYLHQMPTEFLSPKVIELRTQLNLNIVNCHICLTEYNYSLKKLQELHENLKNIGVSALPIKFYYYRCTSLFNLGEFEKANEDLDILSKLLPNDNLVKKLHEDFIEVKKKTELKNKGFIKKGIFSSNLYSDISLVQKVKNKLPQSDYAKNKIFYIDFIINQNNKDPKKIKFEIFGNTSKNLESTYKIIEDMIVNKKFNKNETKLPSFFPVNQSNYKILQLVEIEELKDVVNYNSFNQEINIYPCCEEYLLMCNILQDKKMFLSINLEKISDEINSDILVLGRCIYNAKILQKLNDESHITVLDSGFSLMSI